MPTYFSEMAAHGLEFRRGGYGTVTDPVMGEMRVPIKPLMVRFKPLHQPFPVYGLPGRDGLARGILTPEEGARQIRKRAQEFGSAGDNLPESDEDLAAWVIQKMRKSDGLGSQFVEIDDVAEVADGDAVDDNLHQPKGIVMPTAGVFTKSGSRVYCQVCDKTMSPKGMNGHSKANKHLANLRAREEEFRLQATG